MSIRRTRIETIDAMRVIAMLAVIQLHTPWRWGANAITPYSATIVDQLARFAVPFFFVVSGYFWATGSSGNGDYWPRSVATSKRALRIFLFWSILYGIETSVHVIEHEGVKSLVQLMVSIVYPLHPLGLINQVLQGTKFHLWFLPALAIAALITGTLLARRLERTLFVLAIALFVIGLAGSAYSGAPFGFRANFNFRNGPFFSLIMFASGYAIQRYGQSLALLPIGIGMAVGGFALQHFESTWIHNNWGSSLTHDYVVGTYFFGLGMSMIALSNVLILRIRSLASVGPLLLGVYASHVFFVERTHWLQEILHEPNLREIVYLAIVFLLALTASFILSTWRRTRQFVM